MAEDQTQIFHGVSTDDPKGGAKSPQRRQGSYIFNTSVRGWVALMLSGGLIIAMLAVVIGPFFNASIPTTVETQILTLFTGVVPAILREYFQFKSREGQKGEPPKPEV